jgi:hypothetical protein
MDFISGFVCGAMAMLIFTVLLRKLGEQRLWTEEHEPAKPPKQESATKELIRQRLYASGWRPE